MWKMVMSSRTVVSFAAAALHSQRGGDHRAEEVRRGGIAGVQRQDVVP